MVCLDRELALLWWGQSELSGWTWVEKLQKGCELRLFQNRSSTGRRGREIAMLCYFEAAEMHLKGDVRVAISTINFQIGMFYVGKKLCGKPQQLSANC